MPPVPKFSGPGKGDVSRVGRRGLPRELVDQMHTDYLRLHSLAKVAEIHGRTRQSVYEVFRAHGMKMYARWQTIHEPVLYGGRKWTPGKGGYLRDTNLHGARPAGIEIQLQRQVWVDHHGPIPPGHEVTLIDGDKRNCAIGNLRCLPRTAARRVAAKGANQHTKARLDQRIADNMGWIVQQAQKYAANHPGVDLDDLIQQGRLAIVRADKTFDARRGVKFLTYAIPWIRSYMDRWSKDHSKTVRIPNNRWSGKPENRVRTTEVSMDAPLGSDDESQTWADLLGVEETTTAEATQDERHELLCAALDKLPAPLIRAIRGSFYEHKTLEAMGAEEGVCRERIRQRIVRGLMLLRKNPDFMRRAA